MKKLALVLLIVSVFLSSSGLAQSLNGHEWSIYYDVVEEWHRQLYLTDDDPFEAEEKAVKWAASKYGYTEKDIYHIMDRGVGNRYLTKGESQIYGELTKKLNNLPEGASRAQYDAIHREIANKYDLTIPELHELEYRAYYDFGLWFF